MKLPSSVRGPTTETVGYFATDPATLAAWLVAGLGAGWRESTTPEQPIEELLDMIEPQPVPDRYLLIQVGVWTVVLNNTPLGTDVGVLPTHAARDLSVLAIRATVVPLGGDGYPATILEVFDPESVDDTLRCRRNIYAADDGGRWRFGQHGEPFPFEDTASYDNRRIQRRFTAELLRRYLDELGVPHDQVPDVTAATVVERSL